MEPNMEVIRREGPEAEQYLAHFIQFVYVRTGFNFHSLMTPRHLQKLLDQLAFNRLPIKVWNSLLTATLKIVNKCTTITYRLREFGAFFIDALVWFCRALIGMGILDIAIFLLNWKSSPLIGLAITIIYHAFQWLAEPLWKRLLSFIQSRLASAPYYRHFAIMTTPS